MLLEACIACFFGGLSGAAGAVVTAAFELEVSVDEAATSRSKASCLSPSSTSSRSSRLVSSGWGIGGRDLGLGGGLGGGCCCCCCCSSCCCCCCLLILFSSRWCLSLETSSEVNWMVDVCPPRNFSQPGAPADLGANFELFNKSIF